MKTILKITLSLLFIAASFISCIDDKDFATPQVSCDDTKINEIPSSAITSFENVVNNYVDGFVSFGDADANKTYFIAYVTSSDLKGNFYKEIYVQDSPENPSYGLKLDIDIRGMYAKYPVGSKLYILLNGLGIDKSRGKLTLGENSNESLARIREGIAKTNIFRTCTVETIVAKELVSVSEINDDLIGKFVIFKNAQFIDFGLPFTDPNEQFNTFRDVMFCEDFSTSSIEISSFARFSDNVLTDKKFNISGILTRDYHDDNYVLKINAIDNIEELQEDRCEISFCDPNCEDSFDGGLIKWDAYNIVGSQIWEANNYQGITTAQISGYDGSSQNNEDWLVSKPIDLTSATSATFSFDNLKRYNGTDLEVYISSDYTGGNPTATGTWTQVTATIDSNTNSWTSWVNSGDIDLSSALGSNVYVAFRYVSTTSGSATFKIDNVIFNIN